MVLDAVALHRAAKVSASATGFAPQGFHGANGDDELRLAEGEQRKGSDFVMRGGVAIKGRVNDVTGVGGVVAGALVAVSFWDAPGRGRCTRLLSADMNHEQEIAGVRIENPFL